MAAAEGWDCGTAGCEERLSQSALSSSHFVIVSAREQFTSGANRTFDLPLSAAAVVAERIQCADFRESRQFIATQPCLRDQIFDAMRTGMRAAVRSGLRGSGLGARGWGRGSAGLG